MEKTNKNTKNLLNKPIYILIGGIMIGALLGAAVMGSNFTPSKSYIAQKEQQSASKIPVKNGYADVNGLKMYYEIHGEGKPLVLLHGAYLTSNLSYGKAIPMLAKDRQVIVIEQQGHGHTGDIDRPLSYKQMAEDTAMLLQKLNIKNADIFGYSMGGNIALELAAQHPELVNKLIVTSSAYKRDGWDPAMLASISSITPEIFTGSGLPEEYVKVAPNPKNWPVLVEKLKKLDMDFAGQTAEEIKLIKAPTLIIVGDSDSVQLGHAVELFALLGGGVNGDMVGLPVNQLAVLPNTSHIGMLQRTDLWIPILTTFINAPMPTPSGAHTN